MSTESVEARVRTNGFQTPLHPFQILSWVVVGLDVLIFAVVDVPLMELGAVKISVGAVFGVTILVLVLGAVQATRCDPADPHIKQQNLHEQVNKKGEEENSLPHCESCDSRVLSRSKHCRACNKCVEEFDHHCMWLNNCIGASNYRAFVVCIGAVAVMTAIILSVSIYLFIDYFANDEEFEIRWRDHVLFQSVAKEVALVPFSFLVLVNLPFFVLDMQLVLLHVFFTWQNVTTFEYIRNKRDATRQSGHKAIVNGNSKKFNGLPNCMDWIVFCNFCNRRRRKSNEKTKKGIPPKTMPVASEALADAATEVASALPHPEAQIGQKE